MADSGLRKVTRIIYRQDGTIDLAGTRELMMGCPTEEELDMAEELLPASPIPQSSSDPRMSEYEEFWSDSCWRQPSGPIG